MSTSTLAKDIGKAEHYVGLFEQQVIRGRGKTLATSYEAKEAMARVKSLAQENPGNAEIQALVERVRQALIKSKGDVFEITPEMLRYRQTENEAREIIAGASKKEWEALLAKCRSEAVLIENAYPIPDPVEGDAESLRDKLVLIENFQYPDNQFTSVGKNYVFCGDPSNGFYFAMLDGPGFRSAYTALRRYRDGISPDVGTMWTVLARLKGRILAVPEAGAEPKSPAEFGWEVEVSAIYIPDKVLAQAATAAGGEGALAGESEAKIALQKSFSHTSVPPETDPKQLLRIFATSIKEKNHELFKECVHPSWMATEKAIERLNSFWEINLRRFHELYVHVEPDEPGDIIAVRGEIIDEAEDFFLTDADSEKVLSHADPLVEQVIVFVKRYNERGKQEGPPNPIKLRREQKGRWFVYTGFPL